MTHEAWTIIIALVGINVGSIVAAAVHLTTRLTRIETDLKWIKAGCPLCQPKGNPQKED